MEGEAVARLVTTMTVQEDGAVIAREPKTAVADAIFTIFAVVFPFACYETIIGGRANWISIAVDVFRSSSCRLWEQYD